MDELNHSRRILAEGQLSRLCHSEPDQPLPARSRHLCFAEIVLKPSRIDRERPCSRWERSRYRNSSIFTFAPRPEPFHALSAVSADTPFAFAAARQARSPSDRPASRVIAQQIVDDGGDYALALKGNQGMLHDDVTRFLDDPASKLTTAAPVVDADHGRVETRTATVSTDVEWLQQDHQWPGLKAIGKVHRRRETAAKTTTETAYYLLSTVLSPNRLNKVVRSHWAVENQLHWRLDVVMNEDQDRSRLGNGPNNLAILRHMALNVMQKDATKGSLRGKLKQAAWDETYLAKLIELF